MKPKIVTRLWTVALDQVAYDAAPQAAEYAEELVDIQVAASPQSLQETKECLFKLSQAITGALQDAYDGEHREKDKRRLQGLQMGLERALELVAIELEVYQTRIEANKGNNGRLVDAVVHNTVVA